MALSFTIVLSSRLNLSQTRRGASRTYEVWKTETASGEAFWLGFLNALRVIYVY
ncbi:hypothetical protein [Calothrix sp. UHCC 0171]|uniref:hypothetical protein n=1 Tax=Calothrix sp. UHCC 0171 TaxID=3110245 RepID=UPI002B1EC43A|nr:hypothetical protein [Calothrix sp. UHCC 0171]MEA5571023.1 hypothetical protein [Calothrix sp. UHCC 0171]